MSLRSIADLEIYLQPRHLDLDICCPGLRTAFTDQFPLRIPERYAELIHWEDPHDPLKLLVLPVAAEQTVLPYEKTDPIGDADKEAVPGLVHRYPNRCLLLLTMHCAVHCRFCFRKDFVGKSRPVDIAQISQYLRQHTELNEIIFSGGDPLTFPSAFLHNLSKQWAKLAHIQTWRFHSRIPVVDPSAVSAEFLAELDALVDAGKKVVLAIHINHPRELDSSAKILIAKLQQHHVQLLSQTVLLKNVNANLETLRELFVSLSASGVQPYYLHHLDPALGTHHFRLSIPEGQRLYTSLRGILPGYLLPQYMVELPGGKGKVPVLSLCKVENQPGTYQATNFAGEVVVYQDPAQLFSEITPA